VLHAISNLNINSMILVAHGGCDGAAGFTFGVVALASLFSTCVECFDYFKAVVVLKAEHDGRAVGLSDGPTTELVSRCLEQIKSLLSDTDKLQSAYGLRASTEVGVNAAKSSNIVSGNSMNIFTTSYRRFGARFANSKTRSGLLTRTKWAIHDKPKFEGLVVHVRDFIDGLNWILLVKRELQDQIVRDDIASILEIASGRICL
jgi:hypothetical protein